MERYRERDKERHKEINKDRETDTQRDTQAEQLFSGTAGTVGCRQLLEIGDLTDRS